MSKSNIKPLGDRVLLQRVEVAEEKSAGGIFIPDSAKEKPQEAIVKAVGPGKLLDDGKRGAMDVKEGDRVIISKWGGTEIKLNGHELLLVSMDDILAISG